MVSGGSRLRRFVIGRVEVEVNPAEWRVGLGLAQNDRHLTVESDAVPKARSPVEVGPNGLLQETEERRLAVFGRFVELSLIHI